MKARRAPGGRKARSQDQPALSEEVIVAEALKLLDEEGLAAFTLRSLSKRLNVYPTAIYWYVPSRNELLARAVDAAFGEMVMPQGGSWHDDLRAIFAGFRETIRAHPNLASLIGAQLVTNVRVNFELVEAILDTLARAGFAGARLTSAYNAVLATIVGFTTQEFAQLPAEDLSEWQEDVRNRIAEVDRERYPTLGRNLPDLANKAFILRWQNGVDNPLDTAFVFTVEALIRGLSTMVLEPSEA